MQFAGIVVTGYFAKRLTANGSYFYQIRTRMPYITVIYSGSTVPITLSLWCWFILLWASWRPTRSPSKRALERNPTRSKKTCISLWDHQQRKKKKRIIQLQRHERLRNNTVPHQPLQLVYLLHFTPAKLKVASLRVSPHVLVHVGSNNRKYNGFAQTFTWSRHFNPSLGRIEQMWNWENHSVSKNEATSLERVSWKTDLKIPARMQGGPHFHRNPKANADSWHTHKTHTAALLPDRRSVHFKNVTKSHDCRNRKCLLTQSSKMHVRPLRDERV